MNKSSEDIISTVKELCSQPRETECVEFKHNKASADEIGEYLSALANSAALFKKPNAYIIWGISDENHNVIGTSFNPHTLKVGNEELINWLSHLLKPKINFSFYETAIKSCRVVLLEIEAAFRQPVSFKGQEFIRIGTYKKKLKDHPEKERKLWKIFEQITFEKGIAAENISSDKIMQLMDYSSYFDLLRQPLPDGRPAIMDFLEKDGLIQKKKGEKWDITNLGAILFAKKIENFTKLKRKAVRIIQYKEKNKMETLREKIGTKGYAAGFKGLIDHVMTILPTNEVIKNALRKNVPMFPDIAVRELIANALIHQDFFVRGAAPTIEIFTDRMEITNPGTPLVNTERFLDSPPKSRNEILASLMRRLGICEERGSGIDKVIYNIENSQLPAPLFEAPNGFTRAVLFSHRPFAKMDKAGKVRACYLHSCLRYIQHDYMTNTTLRKRFGLEAKNSAIISRIIACAIKEKLILCYDESVGAKAKKYVPYWAK